MNKGEGIWCTDISPRLPNRNRSFSLEEISTIRKWKNRVLFVLIATAACLYAKNAPMNIVKGLILEISVDRELCSKIEK